MYNLYIKKEKGKLIPAIEKPFPKEVDLEDYLMANKNIFADFGVYILDRQIRVNDGKDIMDMIGIDKNNNIVIIENKNVAVDVYIATQILRYAYWVKQNKSFVEAMWLKAKDRPDFDIDWKNIQVRIVICAPSIEPTALGFLEENYSVELIEVKRFVDDGEEIILLNRLGDETEPTSQPTNYNTDYYTAKGYDKKAVGEFFNIVAEIEKLIEKNKWDLQKKDNNHLVRFGRHWNFVVDWNKDKKTFNISFRIKQNEIPGFKKVCPYEFEYDEKYGYAGIVYDSEVSIQKLEKTFEWVYNLSFKK
ncbi:MAG: hypothetical protein ABSA74_00330 [Candidatus Staskawiczbacteria bacterium]|jgi:hypothetical protein